MTDEPSAEIEVIDLTADIEAELSDPELAAELATRMEESAEADREFAMTLAAVRSAAGLTQVELAKRIGTSQSHVSQLESGGDMLVSTFLNYLLGAGIKVVSLVVTAPSGDHVSLNLAAMVGRQTTSSISEGQEESIDR